MGQLMHIVIWLSNEQVISIHTLAQLFRSLATFAPCLSAKYQSARSKGGTGRLQSSSLRQPKRCAIKDKDYIQANKERRAIKKIIWIRADVSRWWLSAHVSGTSIPRCFCLLPSNKSLQKHDATCCIFCKVDHFLQPQMNGFRKLLKSNSTLKELWHISCAISHYVALN